MMSKAQKIEKTLSDAQLLQLAEKELLGEAKKAAVRYSVAGPSGWRPCPLPKANKVFLVNTIRNTVTFNRIKAKPSKSVKKFRERKMFKGKNSSGHCIDNIVFKAPAKKEKNNETMKTGLKVESRPAKNSSNKS